MGFWRDSFNSNKYREPEEKNRTIDTIHMFCYYVPKLERYGTFNEGAYFMVKQNGLCYNVTNPLKVRMLCDVRTKP